MLIDITKSQDKFIRIGSITSSKNPLSVGLLYLLYSVIFYSTYRFQANVGNLASKVAYIYNGLFIFSFSFVLFFARKLDELGIVFPEKGIEKKNITFYFAFIFRIAIPIYLLIVYVQFTMKVSSSLKIEDFRYLGLLISVYVILILLFKINRKSPTLSSLTELKRDYFLGKIDTKTAKNHVDIILNGLEISTLLQEKLKELTSVFQKADFELNEVKAKTQILNDIYTKSKDEINDANEAIANSLNDRIFTHFKHYQKIIKEDILKLQFFLRAQLFHYRINLQQNIDQKNIQNAIEKTKSESMEKFNSYLLEWINLLDKFEDQELKKETVKRLNDEFGISIEKDNTFLSLEELTEGD